MTVPRFKSNYGILDVMKGRKALSKHIDKFGHVPVIIHATITCPFGSDDGLSIEYNMDVQKVEVLS